MSDGQDSQKLFLVSPVSTEIIILQGQFSLLTINSSGLLEAVTEVYSERVNELELEIERELELELERARTRELEREQELAGGREREREREGEIVGLHHLY